MEENQDQLIEINKAKTKQNTHTQKKINKRKREENECCIIHPPALIVN